MKRPESHWEYVTRIQKAELYDPVLSFHPKHLYSNREMLQLICNQCTGPHGGFLVNYQNRPQTKFQPIKGLIRNGYLILVRQYVRSHTCLSYLELTQKGMDFLGQ